MSYTDKKCAKHSKMDSEDEYYNDDFDDASDEMDISETVTTKIPSFQTLTADEIVKLMNEEIGHVDSIVEVSRHLCQINGKSILRHSIAYEW